MSGPLGGGGNGRKVIGAGYSMYPAGPSLGTNVTAVNGAYGSYTQMVASTAVALWLVGIKVAKAASSASYLQYAIGTGGAGSETQITEGKLMVGSRDSGGGAAVNGLSEFWPFPFAIPVSTRIAVKIATDIDAVAWPVTLVYAIQSDLPRM